MIAYYGEIVSQVTDMRPLTKTPPAYYRIVMVDQEPIKQINIAAPEMEPRVSSLEWYSPKTGLGRRIMELRAEAKRAGMEFLPMEEIRESIRKMRE